MIDSFLFKTVVTVTIIVVSKKIKRALEESQQFRQESKASIMRGPFLSICIIPFVNNILLLCAEVPDLILLGKEMSAKAAMSDTVACLGMSDFSLKVHIPLTGSSILLCSFLTTLSYWISFPSLRQGCFRNEVEGGA